MPVETFNALVVEAGEDKTYVRQIKNRTVDDLPEGDVLVQVRYSSLNYKDALSASGNRGVTKQYPHTPGIDAAGMVTWSRDSRFEVGDEVLGDQNGVSGEPLDQRGDVSRVEGGHHRISCLHGLKCCCALLVSELADR